MSKPLDLNKSVYELTTEYPELIDIMKDLGFSEIVNPIVRRSAGRMMTIPKGAKVKEIPMAKIISTLLQHDFQLVGKMPDLSKIAKSRQKAAPADKETTEKIKTYLKRLSNGESLETVRADFAKHFASVDPAQIMSAEEELIREGMPVPTVQKLCDVHSALFHDAIHEEPTIGADDQNRTKALEAIPGHPLRTLTKTNDYLHTLYQRIQARVAQNVLTHLPLDGLKYVAVHYAMKGDLLFPLLDQKYGISGPSNVMWTVDNEIRHDFNALIKEEDRGATWKSRMLAVLKRAEEMIYKEENILFPLCAAHFTEDEWMQIYHDAKDYQLPEGISEVWAEAEAQSKGTQQSNLENGEIVMPGGRMTVAQLRAVLNTIPVEITFVDDQNINRFFNEGPKVFKRPKSALNREIFACHPPKVKPMVQSVLDSFRNGTADQFPIWMEKEGKPYLVTYMAVRDEKGNYLGALETVQDMSAAKKHFLG